MSYRITAVDREHEAEAMVAADSFDSIVERIQRMVTAGRGMVLAVREFTYLGEPPVLYAGMRLDADAHGGGFRSGRHGERVRCEATLTNGGGYDGTRWFGFGVDVYPYSGNETEAGAWKRYETSTDGGADRQARRRDMTHIGFIGGLPSWKWQNTDRIVITEYNGDGVATERVLGFEPGEGSW
ncbi:hypothetical protein [Paractinoplanes maris]|uniref:hypothetical protein n=1 Tax=Paractinoplanes maris TaxID=1734446 RepID=UPI0020228E5D|nr:hypothetical protein [Actinoplanes maris]